MPFPVRFALEFLVLALAASAAVAADCCSFDRAAEPCRVESIVARALGASALFAIEPCACGEPSPQRWEDRYIWLWAW